MDIGFTYEELEIIKTHLEGYLGSIVTNPDWDYNYDKLVEMSLDDFFIDSQEDEMEIPKIQSLVKKVKKYLSL